MAEINQYYDYLTDRGVIVPDTSVILTEIENKFKEIWGQNLDTAPTTPQGRLIEMFQRSRTFTIQCMAAISNMFNLNRASGFILDDLGALFLISRQGATYTTTSVVLGGVIFNAANILLSASTSIAGMSVAFPLGVGLSLVLGVIINYVGAPKGDPAILFAGVALIVAAIVCNGIASGRMQKIKGGKSSGNNGKGLALAVAAGVLMSFFYRFVAKAMDLDNFEQPAPGMLTPYTAIFVFSAGVLLSNFLFNTLVMKYPFAGERVYYRDYFKGSFKTHLTGILGGAVWCLGTAFSYIASGQAGAAISYALGQGAPMVAAIWGVFIWKEFRGADRKAGILLFLMFVLFIAGLASIIVSGGN